MKYLILSPDDHRIIHISNDLGYQNNGNYLIYGGTLAIPPVICDMAEVESVPEGVEPERWCYTTEAGFYENPNWVEPEEIGDLTPDEVVGILTGEVE